MNVDRTDKSSEDIFIRNGHLLQRLRLSDIIWIRSEGNYCTFVTKDKKYAIKISLIRVLDVLPSDAFIQIHRSCAVRIDQITAIDVHTNQVFIDTASLPIGRKFKEALISRINLI